MKPRIPVIFLSLAVLAGPMRAAQSDNTALTLVEVVGGILVAVEGVNLAVNAIKKGRTKVPKAVVEPVVETNAPATNLIVQPGDVLPETNRIAVLPSADIPETNPVPVPVTNVGAPHASTNLVMSRIPLIGTNLLVSSLTTVPAETNLLTIPPSILSNLTENEKQDIIQFGRDHYYLVALAYFNVGKRDNAREFMFHSLAIGVRTEEGQKFLKDNFHLSDEEIRTGKARYLRSRE